MSKPLETLLHTAPIGLYLVGGDLRIQYVNPAAEPAFAGIGGGVIGRGLDEILKVAWPPDIADQAMRIFRHTLETGKAHRTPELVELRADRGAIESYDWQVNRITLPDGQYGVACYFRDISGDLQARLAVARSETQYRTLFEAIDEGFCILEMLFDETGTPIDYRFIEANPAFETQTGLRNAIGKTVRELLPDIEPVWLETYGRVAQTGERTRFVDYAKAMGRWFEVDAFRIGRPSQRRVALLFTDITARRQAEERLRESEERLRFTLQAAEFGTWDLDLGTPPPHRATRSLHHDKIFGYQQLLPEWTDKMFFDHVLEEDRPRVERSMRRAALEGSDWQVECRIRRADGVVRWIWASGHAKINDAGQTQRLLGLVTDITERKRNEQALRDADRQKDEFLATLAHELRNPLAAISAATSVLGVMSETPPPVAEMTAIIARQSLQLVRLVDDLLDANRISRGGMTLQRKQVDVGRLVREIISDSHALCEKKGLTVKAAVPDEPLLVDGDPVRIAQVVNNLVHNACQFTPPGGEIRARVERVNGEAVLRITDTGIGMSDDELERVFEMFVQVGQPRIHSPEGLGIGLSLARSIVELHGGKIEARSAGLGQGSEFRVTLPAIRPARND
jgi:PAS domain S-box-containing protein